MGPKSQEENTVPTDPVIQLTLTKCLSRLTQDANGTDADAVPPGSGVPSCTQVKQLLSPTFWSGMASLPNFDRVGTGRGLSDLGGPRNLAQVTVGKRGLSSCPPLGPCPSCHCFLHISKSQPGERGLRPITGGKWGQSVQGPARNHEVPKE